MDPVEMGANAFFELEAPAYLGEGQNFFEQPPFGDIFKTAASQQAVGKAHLQHLLTAFLKEYQDLLMDSDSQSVSDLIARGEFADRFRLTSLLRSRSMRIKAAEGVDMPLIRGFRQVGSMLRDYPLWFEYQRYFFTSSLYRPDGSFHPNPRIRDLEVPPTYAKWASENQHRQTKIKSLEAAAIAEEAFPQGYFETIPKGIHTGEKGVNRVWRILRALEITGG